MKYKPFTIRYFRYLLQFKLTPAGRWLLLAIFFAGVTGSVTVEIPVYQVFCALVGLYTTAWLAGLMSRPRVKVTGALPDKSTVGETISSELVVTNIARHDAWDMMFSFRGLPKSLEHLDQDFVVPCLAAGESTTVPIRLRADRRGLYPLPGFSIHSTFPFNLMRNGSAQHELGSLLVLPTFHPLTGINLTLGTRYQPGGIALTSNVGESPEYIGNREFAAGDSMRRLDFRSWARTGKPVVREFQEEYYCRIALILDTFVATDRKPGKFGFANLEAAVSLTAAVADILSSGEYIIDLFAAGPELHVFRAGRHTAHLENVLEILASVDACGHNPFNAITPAVVDELENISSAVCVFLDWDDARRRLAHAVQEAGCSLKVIVIRDGQTTEPLEDSEVDDISHFSTKQVQSGGIDVL